MIEFAILPDRIGTFENDRPRYNVEVPVKGEPLVPCDFSGLTPSEVVTEMSMRQDRFNQQEILSKYAPATWINVGYYIEPLTIIKQPDSKLYIGQPADPLDGTIIPNPRLGIITAFYQIRLYSHKDPPPVWSNWPFKPPIYEPE